MLGKLEELSALLPKIQLNSEVRISLPSKLFESKPILIARALWCTP